MFKLIKLAIYGLIGYAIYEFVRGIAHGENALQAAGAQGGGQRQGGSRELNAALDGRGESVNMTGPAQGERVRSGEPSGESVPHLVGRGVVSR